MRHKLPPQPAGVHERLHRSAEARWPACAWCRSWDLVRALCISTCIFPSRKMPGTTTDGGRARMGCPNFSAKKHDARKLYSCVAWTLGMLSVMYSPTSWLPMFPTGSSPRLAEVSTALPVTPATRAHSHSLSGASGTLEMTRSGAPKNRSTPTTKIRQGGCSAGAVS